MQQADHVETSLHFLRRDEAHFSFHDFRNPIAATVGLLLRCCHTLGHPPHWMAVDERGPGGKAPLEVRNCVLEEAKTRALERCVSASLGENPASNGERALAVREHRPTRGRPNVSAWARRLVGQSRRTRSRGTRNRPGLIRL